ncbi:MAG: HPF/RaiA family ribosome-associated protein [Candidatus Bostrichicola ureolyticus]|nr:MAG: HPF/RaiA family ribosome-associated protein [Candidatus Bostrichicola ureolyticus]
MKINILNHVENDNILNNFIKNKLSKLENYYNRIISANVYLQSIKEQKIIEIRLSVPGDDIIVKKSGHTFEESVNLAIDALKKMIIKKKEKNNF